jgi:hypothetical protein
MDGNVFALENRHAHSRCDKPRQVVPDTGTKSECSRWCGVTDGQSEARARRKIQQVMRQSEWISAELPGTGSGAYDEPVRPECSESRARSNGTCCDLGGFPASSTRKLGCQLVRRETALVRRAFLALVLKRNRAVGRRGILGVNCEATKVQTMVCPGFSAFSESFDDLKEPGGCEAAMSGVTA